MEYLTQLVSKFISKPQNPEKYILNRNNKNDYFRTEPIICSNYKYEIDIPGAAGLAPYLMGICKVLQEEFKPELEQSIIVGTSVGSFCSLVLASNIQFDDAYYNGTTKFLQAIGKSFMDKSLNLTNNYQTSIRNYILERKDEISLDALENKLFINTSCYQTGDNYIINKFNSHSDITDAITSSSILPLLHTSTTYELDGKMLRDGCFSEKPHICPNLHKVCISLTMFREFPITSFLPNDNIEDNNKLYKLGIQDARDNLEKLKEMFLVNENN